MNAYKKRQKFSFVLSLFLFLIIRYNFGALQEIPKPGKSDESENFKKYIYIFHFGSIDFFFYSQTGAWLHDITSDLM